MTAAVVIIFLPLYIYYDTCLISVFDTVRLKLQSDNQIVYKYVTYIYIYFFWIWTSTWCNIVRAVLSDEQMSNGWRVRMLNLKANLLHAHTYSHICGFWNNAERAVQKMYSCFITATFCSELMLIVDNMIGVCVHQEILSRDWKNTTVPFEFVFDPAYALPFARGSSHQGGSSVLALALVPKILLLHSSVERYLANDG